MPITFEEVDGPIDEGVVIASGSLCVGRQPFPLPKGWVLLIHTSDESQQWDTEALRRPGMKIWRQYPQDRRADRNLLLGWPPETRELLRDVPRLPLAERKDWVFIGQAQTEERKVLVAHLDHEDFRDGDLLVTDGFGHGIARADYLQRMAGAAVAFCPGGNRHPDSFRLYEALEAGCLPACSKSDFWPLLISDSGAHENTIHPIFNPGLWVDAVVEGRTEGLQHSANRATAWWLWYKRQLTIDLVEDCCVLSGQPVPVSGIGVTVLLPTSPVPDHPSTAMIEDTIRRIRAYPELREADILIMVDGIRAEQQHYREVYEEYTRRLIDLCNWHPDFRGCLPVVFDEHLHQGMMMRRTLELVHTPLTFFCEHDMWPEGPIDFTGLARAMLTRDDVKVIRLYRDAEMYISHRELLLEDTRHDIAGVPLVRTIQWSQNPHLAKTDFYREIIPRYFGEQSRTMIEDVLHGVLSNAGKAGWDRWGLWLYAPEEIGGNLRRCGFVNGRGEDPKFPMRIAYDGAPPIGAPPGGFSG
ncbi:MAG: hypothetical protein Q7T26_03365 [Dehalococcoidia bacterium]|nr:hypothetical protein [Dehalococcoidia bacterium]